MRKMLPLTENKMRARPTRWKCRYSKVSSGFTLIELMIVVVILAIIASIAMPSYAAYVRKAEQAQLEQEILKVAQHLERHKSKNFSYRAFDPAFIYGVTSPMNAITFKSYTIQIHDQATGKLLNSGDTDVRGLSWAIKATTADNLKYNYLMTSTNVKCKSKSSISGYSACSGGEGW